LAIASPLSLGFPLQGCDEFPRPLVAGGAFALVASPARLIMAFSGSRLLAKMAFGRSQALLAFILCPNFIAHFFQRDFAIGFSLLPCGPGGSAA
jgi:hypothetical protein